MALLCAQGRCSKDPNQRSVTVTITDVCPECETDHIDIQALTFNKVRGRSALLWRSRAPARCREPCVPGHARCSLCVGKAGACGWFGAVRIERAEGLASS